MGSVVSIAASGRLSARLAIDGLVSFAFIPVIEVASFALIWPRLRAHARVAGFSFGSAFDAFTAGDRPWLFWMLLLALLGAAVEPRAAGPWFLPLVAAALVPFVLVLRADLRFMREALGRSRGAARRDILLLRTIAWSAGLTWFLGFALRAEVVPRWHAWFGA